MQVNFRQRDGALQLRLCVAAILVSLVAAGCATSPTRAENTEPGTYLSGQLNKPSPQSGRVLVKRDSGFMGAGCTHRIYLDGTPAAELRTGQAVTLYVQPGEHISGVMATGICDGNAEASLVIQANQTKSFRSGADQSGSLKIQPTAF